jgi:predicted dehydrogenase
MKKILIVGFGSIGNRHAKNLLKTTDFNIIICTKQNPIISEKLRALFSKYSNRIEIISSIDDAIKKNPSVAFITNETSLHIPIALKLAKAGIDMFIEKPLSHSLKNVERLITITKRKKLITQIGCNLRFFPPIKKIKEMIDSGLLGRIISVHVEMSSYLPDWHPYEDYRKGYAARKELGGGVALTQIHEIDYLYWLFGDVEKAFSVTGKFSNLKINADDLSVSILKFKNGMIAEVHLDYFQRPYYKICKVKGTKGTILWNSDKNTVMYYLNDEKKWLVTQIQNNYKLTSPKLNKMYVDEVKHFLACVRKRQRTINDIEQGKKTLEIVVAMLNSSKLNRMIHVGQ